MGLQFILSRANQSFQPELIKQAQEWLAQSQQHDVFYIVPNYIKFESEHHVLGELAKLSQTNMITEMRLQVFSFSRLAWFFLQRSPVKQYQPLSDTAKNMLVRQLLIEHQDELSCFRQEVEKQGFVDQIVTLINELREGNISCEQLDELPASYLQEARWRDLKLKLADLSIIYRAYNHALMRLDASQQPLVSQLAEHLVEHDLSRTCFIISGFSRLTSVEMALIATLLQIAGNVSIQLCLDKPYVAEPPMAYQLFYQPGKLYYQLYQLARQLNVPIYQDKILKDQQADQWHEIDHFWQASQDMLSLPKKQSLSTGKLQIWSAADAYYEVLAIAQEIRRLVVEQGYRYHDVEILTRDIDQYRQVILPTFRQFQIPCYINQEDAMRDHPLIEFISALFDIDQFYYKYRDMMRLLRTELLLPHIDQITNLDEWQSAQSAFRQQVDVCENVLLAYGFSGQDWTRSDDWQMYQSSPLETELTEEMRDAIEIQTQSNQIRQYIRQLLPSFYHRLKKAKTGIEAAQILFQLLVDCGVERQMLWRRDFEVERGDLVAARLHEQTWQAFVDLLDDYVLILGDSAFNLATFITVLTSGLSHLTYRKVPTTIDQVKVSSLDLTHSKKNRVTFIIGGTNQTFPRQPENNTFLTDEERQQIGATLDENQYLSADSNTQLAQEPYLFYQALLSAQDAVYLTYPLVREDLKDIKISPYYSRLIKQFDCPVIMIDQQYIDQLIDQKRYYGTDRVLLSELVRARRSALDQGQPYETVWKQIENKLLQRLPHISHRVLASLAYRNTPEKLELANVDHLYGETIFTSVSKLESFYQCQYRYFLTYGLQLKERAIYDLSPATAGEFFHDALDQLFKTQQEKGDQPFEELFMQAIEQLLDHPKYRILSLSERMKYIRYQLAKTVKRVAWALNQQGQRTSAQSIQTELSFGQLSGENRLASIGFPLARGKQLLLRGKIDRLDQVVLDQQTYLNVIDYKSSQHRIDFRDIYYGLAMQMVTYLDIALQNGEKITGQAHVQPGGAFYLHIKNPVLPYKGDCSSQQINDLVLKEFTYQGLLLNDQEYAAALDPTLSEKERSLIYPLYKNTKGQLSSTQFIDQAQWHAVKEHNQKNIKQAGEQIVAGDVKLNPVYKDKQRIACQYCPFRSVCQFDVMLKDNQYHRLASMKKDDVLEKITSDNDGRKEHESGDE